MDTTTSDDAITVTGTATRGGTGTATRGGTQTASRRSTQTATRGGTGRSTQTATRGGTGTASRRGTQTGTVAAGGIHVNDQFCWVCHMEEPIFHCPSCPRSYHVQCTFKMWSSPLPRVRFDEINPRKALELLECPECIVANNTTLSAMESFPQENLKKVLKQVCISLRGFFNPNTYINILEREGMDYVEDVTKVMDIGTLERMIDEGAFKTLEGFVGEFKWLFHNTVITEGALSIFTKESEGLVNECRNQMKDVALCPQCYVHCKLSDDKDKWFVMPCKPPHLLLSVKYGQQWWPAKLKNITENNATVTYFGDHKKGTFSLQHCRILSNTYAARTTPVTTSSQKKGNSSKIDAAREELKLHLDALKQMYGGVVLAEGDVHLTEASQQEQLQKMFPEH